MSDEDKKPYSSGVLNPYGGAWVKDPGPFCKECGYALNEGECEICLDSDSPSSIQSKN